MEMISRPLWRRVGASLFRVPLTAQVTGSSPLVLFGSQGPEFLCRRMIMVSCAPCLQCSMFLNPSRMPLLPMPWVRHKPSQVRCVAAAATEAGGKMPARLAQKQLFLEEKTGEALSEEEMNAPIPKISEEKVTVTFARSGGPGGQNVNKVNTKVDMRFNVYEAEWLPERIRLKILDQEANRINSEGELVVSSTKTRTQKGNIEDALQKMQKIIDAAAYVPPPPSAEKQAKINKLAKAENERRLQTKKLKSNKKADRRSKGSWD